MTDRREGQARRTPPLPADARAALEAFSQSAPPRIERRARAVLLAGDGRPCSEVAATLAADRTFVRRWVKRYRTGGLAALIDAPRPGRPRRRD